MLTPLIAAYVVGSILAGGITSGFKYYNPAIDHWHYTLHCGLSLTHHRQSTFFNSTYCGIAACLWIWCRIRLWSAKLPGTDIATIRRCADRSQFHHTCSKLSASIFVAVAQSVFQGELHKDLESLLPDSSNSSSLLLSALPRILSAMPSETQSTAKEAISSSIIRTFYASLALRCVSVIGALGVKWVPMSDHSTQTTNEDSQIRDPRIDKIPRKSFQCSTRSDECYREGRNQELKYLPMSLHSVF